MPATATATASGSTEQPVAAPAALVPWVRASREHTEPIWDSGSLAAGADFGPFDVPAYGFLQGLLVEVQVTSTGNSATVALHEDCPFSALASLSVSDVNSTPIVGPIDGYGLYLADKWLATAGPFDPKLSPGGFSQSAATNAATAGSCKLQVRVPITAIRRTGLGALANANSSTTYKVKGTLGALASMFTTVPNGTVTFRVKVYMEARSVPAPQDWRGRQQEQVPPGNGTTAYLSKYAYTALSIGTNTVRLPRVGNYLRSLILVFRSGSGPTARSTAEAAGLPDPLAFYVDTRLMHSQSPSINRRLMAERIRGITATFDAAGGPDNGVMVLDGCHDYGTLGNENGDGWLPTLQSTRAELQFTSAFAGSLTVYTHDVAPPQSNSM